MQCNVLPSVDWRAIRRNERPMSQHKVIALTHLDSGYSPIANHATANTSDMDSALRIAFSLGDLT